jgi:hypothetical protein
VLGIRDILVRIRIQLLSSVTLKDTKKKIFFLLFCYLSAGKLSSVIKLNFLLKFCVNILFFKYYFSPLNTFNRKGKDSDPDPDPYL